MIFIVIMFPKFWTGMESKDIYLKNREPYRLYLYTDHESGFESLVQKQGAVSIRKTVLPGMAIPILKIRRPNGRLIFNMDIAIRR